MPNLFPYTNTHELNLDWILQVVKDFQSKYTNFDQTIADALEAIEAAKTGSLEDMQTALTNALSAISTDQAAAQAAIAEDQSAALLALQAALTAALTSITTEQTNATQIIEQLYNTLPASAQEILGRLRVLDTIITGYTPSNSFQWLQGSYIYPEGVTPPTPPEINSTSETFNNYVSSRYMAGVAGQRIRITTDGTILIDVINIWTSNPPGGAPSQFIVEELEVSDTYADVILPLNVTAFSVQLTGPTEESEIAPTDIPGHIDIRWVTDFVGQATIAPKETSNTANVARETGELFFLDGILYAATSDIAIGDTIVTSGSGANCEETTIDEELQEAHGRIEASFEKIPIAIPLQKGKGIDINNGKISTSPLSACPKSLWYADGISKITLDSAIYKMRVLSYTLAGDMSAANAGYIGHSNWTNAYYFPESTKKFALTIRRVDNGAMTDSDVSAAQQAIHALVVSGMYHVSGKMEFGGLNNSNGNATNADYWFNTRSEKTYKVQEKNASIIISMSGAVSNNDTLTVLFYNTSGQCIGYVEGSIPVYNFAMPDNAVYFRLKISPSSAAKRHEYFTLTSCSFIEEVYNFNIINQSVGSSLAFSYEVDNTITTGRLLLPPNYAIDGDKVPLIVFVHGSGGMLAWNSVLGVVYNWSTGEQELTYLPYLQYLANEGFAIFDCYPWTKAKTIPDYTFSPWNIPLQRAAYLRGIEYVCSRYNVDISRVSMICKSQGGHIGQWAIMQHEFPFKSVCLFAPSCGIGMSALFSQKKARQALVEHLDFAGTQEEISAFINNGSTSNELVRSFINKNNVLLLSMNPMTQGITNGALDTLIAESTSGQAGVPQWMLDLGLPAKPEGARNIYPLSGTKTYVKNSFIPSKFWAAFDDDQVSGYTIFGVYYWLANGGSDTAFRQMPTGTGGHHSVDTDENAPKSSGTTALGISYTDIPTAYVEAVEFIRSKCGG